MQPNHAAEIRQRLIYPRALVQALGLGDGARRQPGDGVTIRCPVHDERTPSCSVTVGPDGTVRFRCFACGASGDALTLVAAAYQLDLARDFPRVLQAAAQLAGYDLERPERAPPPPPRRPVPPPSRPPRAELEALWDACDDVCCSRENPLDVELPVLDFLAKRGLPPNELAVLDVARVTPAPAAYDWPSWWPRPWTKSWRLVALAYEPDGTPASLHARAVDGSLPKTRWPLRCAADGLVFANRIAHSMLLGLREPERVYVAEGMTDFLATSLMVAHRERDEAVIGITSGSAPALGQIDWPKVNVLVMTHADGAGERYYRQVLGALPPGMRCVRWEPEWVDEERGENETNPELH